MRGTTRFFSIFFSDPRNMEAARRPPESPYQAVLARLRLIQRTAQRWALLSEPPCKALQEIRGRKHSKFGSSRKPSTKLFLHNAFHFFHAPLSSLSAV